MKKNLYEVKTGLAEFESIFVAAEDVEEIIQHFKRLDKKVLSINYVNVVTVVPDFKG